MGSRYYRKLVKTARKKIKNGLKQIDKNEIKKSQVKAYLFVVASKSTNLLDAITLLCKKNFNSEAIIILRTLVENSINMRWITQKDTPNRLEKFIGEQGSNLDSGFGNEWAVNLWERMKSLGFPRDYYDYVVKLCTEHVHVNFSSLEWNKIFPLKKNKPKDEAIYSIAAQMLGHTMQALDTGYKEIFDYKEIFKKMKE